MGLFCPKFPFNNRLICTNILALLYEEGGVLKYPSERAKSSGNLDSKAVCSLLWKICNNPLTHVLNESFPGFSKKEVP